LVDVIGYYELNQEKIDGIDFIVSAVDLSNLYFQMPVFTVSVFLKSDEISQIRNAMNQMQVSRNRKRSEVSPISSSDIVACEKASIFARISLVMKNTSL